MTFDRAQVPGRSSSSAMHADADATPGKQTLVEQMSAAGGHADALPAYPGRGLGALGGRSASEGAGDHAHGDHAHGDHAAQEGERDAGHQGAELAGPAGDEGQIESSATDSGGSVEFCSASSGGAADGHTQAPAAEGATPAGPPASTDLPVSTAPPTIESATVKSAPGGEPDTRTKVGVGEVVRFTGSVAGTWSATHGTRHGESGKHFRWTTPATPGTTTIKLTTSGGGTATKEITAIAPNHLSMKRKSVDSFPSGSQGAGMKTDVTIGPSSVNFGNLEWLEVPGGPSEITGYFKTHKHLNHHPNPKWLPWNDSNTGLWDHAWLAYFPKPWSPGKFQWTIPNKYRVGSAGGDGHVFATTHQVFHITNTKGTTTISKGGAYVSRTP